MRAVVLLFVLLGLGWAVDHRGAPASATFTPGFYYGVVVWDCAPRQLGDAPPWVVIEDK